MNIREIADLQQEISFAISCKNQNDMFTRVISSNVLTGYGNYDLRIKKSMLEKEDVESISAIVKKRNLSITEAEGYFVIFKPQTV